MLRTTLRAAWSHKRRLVSTSLAVLLGVAFMAGTLVLADTIDQVFDDLFAEAYENVDVQVQGVELFSSQIGPAHRAPIGPDLLEEVRAVDGVRAAEPWVFSMLVTLLDPDGRAVGGATGAFIESWIDSEEVDFGYRMTEGRPPADDAEAALNRAAATDAGYEVGDEISLLTPEGRREYTLVGTFGFGEADSVAGTVAIELTLAETQRLANRPDQFDGILAIADDGVTPEDLVERIAPLLPEDAEVLTGAEVADQEAADIKEALGFFSQILLVFAGIALFVGSFIIYNTFSILVAQRTRELALLRAVGAGRGQVLGSVLVEAVLVGLVAAVLGIGVGMLLGAAALALLGAIGLDLPAAGLVLRPQTVVTALIVGLAVTVLAALPPALRATRVAPLAALRDVGVDRSGASRVRAVAGAAVLAAGVAMGLPALTDDSGDAVPLVGLGAVVCIVGLLILGPVIARPLARTLGAWLPRARGVTGTLARENAVRSPKRTASTSAALMIGVALVAFITVFAASTRAAISAEVERGFRGDFIVQSGSSFTFTRVSPTMAADLAEVEGVELASSLRAGEVLITLPDGSTTTTFVAAVDPATFPRVLDMRMDEGSLSDLGPHGMAVDRQAAAREGLAVGDEVTLTFPGGGTIDLTVDLLSDDPTTGGWTMALATFADVSPEQVDTMVGVVLADGVDPDEVEPGLQAIVDRYPGMTLYDRDGFIGSLADQVNQLLNIVYGLLAMSIIIAVIGIANTISLSVHERTRELGLLRAVGMTRGQLRAAIRWESVLVALLGSVLGLLLGVAVGFAMSSAAAISASGGLELPVTQLLVLGVLGGATGVVAALRPSQRASRLAVLEAIATE